MSIPTIAPSMAFIPNLTGYLPEVPLASTYLLLTEEFYMTTPITLDDKWFCPPISGEDARRARRCHKTGLIVPGHAQVEFEGKIYASGWQPATRPDWWKR